MGKKFTIEHFISEGEKRTTIYNIINRIESGKNAKHHSGGGWPTEIFNKQAKKNSSDWSITKMACLKDNSLVTHSYINRVIKSMGNTKIQETKDSRQKRSTKVSQ